MQLWASILSECVRAASVQSGPKLLSTIVTWQSVINVLMLIHCPCARPDLTPSCHARYSVLAQLLLDSEGLATVLTVEDSHNMAVVGLVLRHVA